MTDEQESPVLFLDSPSWIGPVYSSKRDSPWICGSQLGKLFELDNAQRICLVAKSRGDRTTYKIELDSPAFRYPELVKPIYAMLYRNLSSWLKKQIAAGRPHIGVRIIK